MDDKPLNRRLFFRHGLRELLRPLNNAAAPIEAVIRQIGALEDERTAKTQATPPAVSQSGPSNLLGIPIRPPGALPEQKFRETCSRCGECVRVCPAQCIRIDPSGVKGAGAPFIDVDLAACVMCDGLLCMNTCPSGALVPTPIGDIDMGTAVWHEPTCVRTGGEACTICVDRCPIGEVAIKVEAGKVHVIEDGCTGCGMCQNWCPTNPKSITVTPRASAAAAAENPEQRRSRSRRI